MPKIRHLANFAISAIALCLSLVVAELLLSQVLPHHDRFFVWPPNLKQRFQPQHQHFAGISGDSWFVTNSQGIRGTEIPSSAREYLLAVGGSATECLYLDQKETWPALVEQSLSVHHHAPVWVGNIGQSGRSARHNFQQLRYLTQQFPQIRTVLLLVGVNDLLFRLTHDSDFLDLQVGTDEFNRATLGHSFTIYPDSLRYSVYDPQRTIFKKSSLWSVLQLAKSKLNSSAEEKVLIYQDERGEGLAAARQRRQQSRSLITTLPDLTSALAEYRSILTETVKIGRQRGIRLVLITQPTLWSSTESEDLFWSGKASRDGSYYSADALNAGMNEFNLVLREVAIQNSVELLDLSAPLSGDTESFYDDMHFNELGAQKVAKLLVKHLIADSAPQ